MLNHSMRIALGFESKFLEMVNSEELLWGLKADRVPHNTLTRTRYAKDLMNPRIVGVNLVDQLIDL